ncbi:MAG: hypothetical protein HKM24_03275 [Gammaproteobacteria bacterium]|nr:hypothetical protein [Gammaproteobacteria bacterium]
MFDSKRARPFQPRDDERYFIEVNVAGDVESRVSTTFGEQVFRGPYFINISDNDNVYGIAAAEFYATHESIGPRRGGYTLRARKSANVEAYQLDEAGEIETTTVNGNKELVNVGAVGMWFVRQPGGDSYVMSDDQFQARYKQSEQA